MKKYVLAMLMMVVMMVMAACSEEAKPVVEKETETKVEEPAVVEEPKEEVEEPTEVVETTETTETGTAAVVTNYENTVEGVQSEINSLLAKNYVALSMEEKSPYTLDTIKSWYTDFDSANAQMDIYLAKLQEKGLVLSDKNNHSIYIKKVEEVEPTVWKSEVENTDVTGSVTVKTIWNLVVKPNAEGNLVIESVEIK